MHSHFRDNMEKSRFELDVDGQIVFADYRRQGSSIVIPHVEAPPALRGTGAAARLMQAIVDKADAEGSEIVPLCGYAAAWVRRNRKGTTPGAA